MIFASWVYSARRVRVYMAWHQRLLAVLSQATDYGFKFKEMDFSDVVLAVKHFSTQARGSDEIPQCIVAKALLFLD